MRALEEHLMEWLRDAHAAEQQAEMMLSQMAPRVEQYPALKARIEQHIEETRRHAERVNACIERRGGSTSALKDTGATMLGPGQAVSGMFAGDEVMKGCIASYAFEAMEVASYRILAAAARSVGDHETAKVSEEIMEEEQAMADWLAQHMPNLTERYLALSAA